MKCHQCGKETDHKLGNDPLCPECYESCIDSRGHDFVWDAKEYVDVCLRCGMYPHELENIGIYPVNGN